LHENCSGDFCRRGVGLFAVSYICQEGQSKCQEEQKAESPPCSGASSVPKSTDFFCLLVAPVETYQNLLLSLAKLGRNCVAGGHAKAPQHIFLKSARGSNASISASASTKHDSFQTDAPRSALWIWVLINRLSGFQTTGRKSTEGSGINPGLGFDG